MMVEVEQKRKLGVSTLQNWCKNLTRIAGMVDSDPSEKVMACATED